MSYDLLILTFAKKIIMISFHQSPLIELNEVTSTNTYLQELLLVKQLPEGTVVSAAFQTAGRGMGSNSWVSEKGKNAIFSLLLYPNFIEAENQFLITQVVSIGLYEWIRQILPDRNTVIKWPNDILVDGKKICGILAQSSIMGTVLQYTIIGVGLNLNQKKFGHLDDYAGSVFNISGKIIEPVQAILEVRKSILEEYILLHSGQTEIIRNQYLNALFLLNEKHYFSCHAGTFEGEITGVNRFGQLQILDSLGEIRIFNTKEVVY